MEALRVVGQPVSRKDGRDIVTGNVVYGVDMSLAGMLHERVVRSVTCGPYDRAQALINGTVKPEGIELDIHVNPNDPGRQTKSRQGKFDIVEWRTGGL
jgi:hypothetical protein